jgi:phospholipid/cholesterol/gamma-HCH transport system substrate-binding protein
VKENDLELKVGALILGALAILGVFLYALGNFSLGPGYIFYVDYRFSGNIQKGAPVKVSGIKVGKIEDIEFLGGKLDPKTGRRVQVRLKVWVQDRVKETIREDAEFFVNTAGVLGEQYLEVVPGNYEKPPLAAGSVVVGVDPPRTDLIVSRLYEFLDSVTTLLHDDKDLIKDLLRDGAGAIHQLNVSLTENREAIGRLLNSTDRLASEGAAMLADVRTGMGDPHIIGKTLVHVDQTIVSSNQAITTLTPKVGSMLDEGVRVTGMLTDKRVDKVFGAVDSATVVLDKGGEVLGEAKTLMTNINAGKGTVGKVLTKDDLYSDIKEMVVNLKRNPWKLIWKE